MNLAQLTLKSASEWLQTGMISARQLTEAVLARIKQVEGQVSAYVTIDEQGALAQAALVDQRRRQGESLPPLAGIPIAIKDNMCIRGLATTCSSKMLENFIPPYDATVIEKLKAQGVVLIGKTNLDEFAMGSSCENSRFKPTCNPWDLKRVPGGSSGGSAAAVAADECLAALGSDTGGSIRQPASFCGVVGLKPTYGLVSRYGLVAFASSLDQIGPLTKDVSDAALLLSAICGHDERDSTSLEQAAVDYCKFLQRDIKGLKIGLPKEYFIDGLDEEVKQGVMAALEVFKSLGASVVEISLPHTKYAVATYYILATAEASSNLARYDGVRYGYRHPEYGNLLQLYENSRQEGFGAEVKRRIMLGTYVLSSGYYDAYYIKGQKVRTLIKADFERAFEDLDLIITPTSPTPAFALGEKTDDPLQMYLSDIYTISVNIAGIPAISLPCGFSSKGLPIGLQLIGNHLQEGKILQAAYAFEQATDYHQARPQLPAEGCLEK